MTGCTVTMMAPCILAALVAGSNSIAARAQLDVRVHPLTIEAALFKVPDVTGHIIAVSDADGDGVGDLAMARGGKRGISSLGDLSTGGYDMSERIDLVSSRTGKLIRTIWQRPVGGAWPCAWDAAGDSDGDGIPDLVLGFPADNESFGEVVVISGKTADVRYRLHGSDPDDRLGSSIAFIGDVDGDGCDDFAVGAVQFDPSIPLFDAPWPVSHQKSVNGHARWYLLFADNTDREMRACWHSRMSLRSQSPGYVSIRSGRDGSELRRVYGTVPGQGFGAHVRPAGDFDHDCKTDMIVQCDLMSDEPVVVLSSASEKDLARLPHRFGLCGSLGDLDGDGTPDLYLDAQNEGLSFRYGAVCIVSGRTHHALFEALYPDGLDEFEVTVAMGDMDGDGVPDFALGGPNFNVEASLELDRDGKYHPQIKSDFSNLTLKDALAIPSEPRNAFSWESGAMHLYSGRTNEVILGVWGAPGSTRGMGLEVVPLPDVNGDGFPDFIVADESTGYVFAGPGPRK